VRYFECRRGERPVIADLACSTQARIQCRCLGRSALREALARSAAYPLEVRAAATISYAALAIETRWLCWRLTW
jgi:hypothetical protein